MLLQCGMSCPKGKFPFKTGYQNYIKISPHTNQNAHHQKNLKTINPGEDVEKWTSPTLLVGIYIGNSQYGEQHGGSLKNEKYS